MLSKFYSTISIAGVYDFSIIPYYRMKPWDDSSAQPSEWTRHICEAPGGQMEVLKVAHGGWNQWFFWKVGDGVACFLNGLKGDVW